MTATWLDSIHYLTQNSYLDKLTKKGYASRK
jgi:hypothetical protein